jgi:putative redox protein
MLKKLILKLKYGNVLERYHWTHRYSKVFVHYYLRNGQLIMDEPKSIEGKDLGPDPFLHS